MTNYNSFLRNKIISHEVYLKLSSLWQKTADALGNNSIFINSENIINNQEKYYSPTKFDNFQLIIDTKIQALLFVEKQINDFYYQITITFVIEEIKEFCHQIKLKLDIELYTEIENYLKNVSFNQSNTTEFAFSLLEIFSDPFDIQKPAKVDSIYNKNNSIEEILKSRIEQENILHTLTQQIQDNLELDTIIQNTIERVKDLLKIDRVLIYQIDVPITTNSITKLADLVTYETKASEGISSVLNFKEDNCLQWENVEQKYIDNFILVINDIDNCSLSTCLTKVMVELGVKSKVVVPIIVKHKLWALLIVHQCTNTRNWDDNEIKFLKHISEYLAVAVYQHNYYQQLEGQKQALEKQVEKKAKQLQDALILAEVAQQSKTDFLGSISHELRTPLTCIIGLSGTLLHWSNDSENNLLSPEKEARYLKIIQESGRKLLQLINNILDFAEIESGKFLLNIEEVFIENIAQSVLLYGLEIAKNKGVALTLDYQATSLLNSFYADGERLYQILLNLVDNAIKFTAAGGEVILKIWGENDQVIFQVQDTGIGIYEEQIPLLFKRFQQLENYRTRTNPGTGLGLALTRHLVELHGGFIEVSSLVGKGSTFTVYLPNSKSNLLVKQEENTYISVDDSYHKTIVIICDDDEIGTFLCELLTAANYQVIWLFDATEVVEKISLIEPRVIILEQSQFTALKLASQIKSIGDDSSHLIVIRDKISGQDWEDLSNSGVDEYLLKPLQPRILLRKIGKAMTLSED